jgi:hypothetical protein
MIRDHNGCYYVTEMIDISRVWFREKKTSL